MTELQALQVLATSPRFLAVLGVILYAYQRRAAIGVGIRRIASRAKSLIVKVKPEGGVQLSMPSLPTVLLAAAIVMGLAQRGCTWPSIKWPTLPSIPVVSPSTPATAATYVYEQRSTPVPSEVFAGLNRLNREKKIVATVFDQDTIDGDQQVPDQYKVPLAAAKEAGLPALVVTAGDKVLKVVKAPTTEQQIVEAVQ